MCTIKNSSTKRYKCPYCGKHDVRDKLITHIDDEHSDMIPQDYTASRVLFNYINKKEYGTCVCGCGRQTAWNEDLGRYERLTRDPKCKERYIKFQEKMLAGRRISGTYKIEGESFTYTGQYEKNTLEFLDKAMHCGRTDIICPIPYEYNDEAL